MLHEVNIAGLTLDPASNTPILILKAIESEHSIPIWIGLLEATSIASALQQVTFERPMTHDLFKNFMGKLKVSVTRVEVCDLRNNTFFAQIYFTSDEKEFNMDARPSDAIAIAIRFNAPIFVDDKVIEQFKMGPAPEQSGEPVDKTEDGKQWADYLEKLSPDEFGKYKM